MSPAASLIGREFIINIGHQALTNAVERLWNSVNNGSPNDSRELYSIIISRKRDLTITKILKTDNRFTKNLPTDEGFESDIDSVSLLSSDGDSVNCVNVEQATSKKRDSQTSDSANSSSASDSSDTETGDKSVKKVEHFNIDSVVCYTNVRFPKVIAFVVKRDINNRNEIIVFEFQSSEHYDRIRYAFNSLSSAAVNRNVNTSKASNGSKFNLLHRTDENGVMHIEISRESGSKHNYSHSIPEDSSSIISINAPDVESNCLLRTPRSNEPSRADKLLSKMTNLSKMRSNSHVDLLNENTRLHNTEIIPKQDSKNTLNLKSRSNSHADLLDDASYKTTNYSNTLTNKSRSNSYADLLNEKPYRSNNANERNQEIDCIIRSDVDTDRSESDKSKVINVNLYKVDETALRKVWRSADDILDGGADLEPPKKPERRKKMKGKAPPPPNVMKGQYVRVAVDPNKRTEPSNNISLASFESNKIQNYNSNWVYVASQPTSMVLTTIVNSPTLQQQNNGTSYDTFKNSSSEFRTEFIDHRAYTMNRKGREPRQLTNNNYTKWTNSVQRMPKVPRSRSESRYPKNNNNNPYRFVDTTVPQVAYIYPSTPISKTYAPQPNYTQQTQNYNSNMTNPSSISNRLFGLSQKLKEFGTNVVNTNHKFVNNFDNDNQKRRSSLGEMTYKANVTAFSNRYAGSDSTSNLKSVIKKQNEKKNSNEKKVTFSAFATVQVV